MAEKTEKATPKKLRDARKKGQVAKSQDFPSAFTFVTAIFGTIFAASYMYENLGSFIIAMFKSAANPDLDLQSTAGSYFSKAIMTILKTSAPLAVVVAFVGVVVNFLIVGPLFSFQVMKFDLKKLDPIQGIKQKFKLKTLVELLKSILKITGAAIIIYYVIWNSIPQVIMTAAMPVIGSAALLNDFLFRVAVRVGIFFLIVAIFDLAFQKKNFAKEMKMEKFEVKQEYKDTEGDPLIKGKRREVFREIAYQEGPSAARRAKAIVTNPIHIAVAVGYDNSSEEVPTILTMGRGTMAEQIIEIGVANQVPVMRNVELARELYQKGEIGDYIPKDTYKAVAEVLKWIESLEGTPDYNVELFK